jgi:hypothetical protein
MTRSDPPEMQLLELLRRSDQPTIADQERVRQSIALQLAAGATVTATLVAAQHGSWLFKGGTIAAWIKGATLASVIIGTSVATTRYLTTNPARPADVVEARSVPAKVRSQFDSVRVTAAQTEDAKEDAKTEVRELPSEAVSGGEATTPIAKRVPNKGSLSQKHGGNLDAELALIGQAQSSLKAGQPADALRALEEHQRRFPSGALSLERVGVRTVALCQSGRLDEGRSAARSYLRKVPNSVLSKRIRVACKMTDE